MRFLIVFSILQFPIFLYSQANVSTLSFDLDQNGKIFSKTTLPELLAPVKIDFDQSLNGTEIILKQNNQEVFKYTLGDTDWPMKQDPNTLLPLPFTLNISEQLKTSPLDKQLSSKDLTIVIGDTTIKVSFSEKQRGILELDSITYSSGYLIYDAFELRYGAEGEIKFKILEDYGVNASNISNNPYLEAHYGKLLKSKSADFVVPQAGGGMLMSNLGNLDVTTFATGLARFLAERTKEELNQAFFSKMKDQLNAYPELKTVFPNTSTILNTIDNYSYNSVLNVLKEAFETDVQGLPDNLYNLTKLSEGDCQLAKDKKQEKCIERLKIVEDFFNNTSQGAWTTLGLRTIKEANQSGSPAELIRKLSVSEDLDSLFSQLAKDKDSLGLNIASSLRLVNLLSQSLLSQDTSKIWVGKHMTSQLFKDHQLFETYLGLVVAAELKSEEEIVFYSTRDSKEVPLSEWLISNHGKYTDVKNLISNVHHTFSVANEAVLEIKSARKEGREISPTALYNYYNSFSSSLGFVVESPVIEKLSGESLAKKYNTIKQYIDPSVDLVYHISTKKPTSAIYDAIILLTSFFDNTSESDNSMKVVSKSFAKYGTLISTVASAENSDEVKAAIEASVLPAGSSAIKRNSNWSVSVNAYVGGYYGKTKRRFLVDSLGNIDTIGKKTYGLFAPIGVSLNKGFKCGVGLSITAQVLDLGALVNFYLVNGDQATLPDKFVVRLSNIFAPGFSGAINLPRVPLSIQGGGQLVPSLYQTSQIEENAVISTQSVWRWHASLVVDIPLFNVWVKDFNK